MIWNIIPHQKLLGRASQIAIRQISMSNPLRKTFYEVLGLPNDASQADIKKAYFELSKKYHPDRIEATDENLAKFREISTAYEVLGNENSRKLYDRGFLGDSTKAVQESVEAADPIVKFYKQRQELAKENLKPAEEVKAWTPPLRKQQKSPILQKYNYYRKPHELVYIEEHPLRFLYMIVMISLGTTIFLVNIEGTPFRKMWKEITG